MNKEELTFLQLVNLYTIDRSKSNKKSTMQANQYLLSVLSVFHNVSINKIDKELVKKFTDQKLEKCNVSYINKILTYIKKVFNWAVREGYIDRNPLANFDKYRDAVKEQRKIARFNI